MRPINILTAAMLLVVCAPFATAAEPADTSTDQPKTLLAERGKLIVSDDLKQPLGAGWRVGKGKWEVADGAIRSSELAADAHGAVARYDLKFDDAVIQYSFKLDGAKTTTLSINTTKGHLCRVLITPNGLSIRKDDMDKKGPDKAVVLQENKQPIAAGQWHTLVVEIRGQELLTSLDGQPVALGEHEAIAAMKANFGLTVAGESVSFKSLRVYEALPNPNWPATKTQLQAKLKTAAK